MRITKTISGELNFSTVMPLWQASLDWFNLNKDAGEYIIDLSAVTAANSAALALFIECLKYARNKNKLISFVEIPSKLKFIAKAAGIENLM